MSRGVAPAPGPTQPSLAESCAEAKTSNTARLLRFVGVCYMILSVGTSIAALGILTSHLSNDFFWPAYDATAIGAIYNQKLSLVSTEARVELASPVALLPKAAGAINPAYPRLIMFQDLAIVGAAIAALRSLSPLAVLTLAAPYCWADFGKQWEMAYTEDRQARCAHREADNAAVYLEAVLRNIDLAAFIDVTQGKFKALILTPIAASGAAGETWVAALLAHEWSAPDVEEATWRSYQLSRFTLQFGNFNTIGIVETVDVVNVFGLRYAVPIKAMGGVSPALYWTTSNLYGLLYDDLYAIGFNQSLVRRTTNFWADIDPGQIEFYNNGSPLGVLALTLHNTLGRLGAIDAIWVPPPPSIVAAVGVLQAAVAAALSANVTFAQRNDALRSLVLTPKPRRWNDPAMRFAGGNLLCLNGEPRAYVQESLGFDDPCSAQLPLKINWDSLAGLFALQLLNTTSTSFCDQCPGDQQAPCIAAFASTQRLQSLLPPTNISIPGELGAVSIVQYVYPNEAATSPEIQELPVLDPTWAFFGALALFDWATNVREVICLQGDKHTFTVISKAYEPLPQAPLPGPDALSTYLWVLSVTVTSCLTLVAAVIVLLSAQRCRGPRDLFFFNRIANSVWISRSAVFARGVAAVACLSTAQLEPAETSGAVALACLVVRPRAVLISAILAGEATWLLYGLQEVVAPLYGRGSPRFAAPIATAVAWGCVALLDTTVPVQARASLSRNCHVVSVDRAIACRSGVVAIGSAPRAAVIAAIFIASVIATIVGSWYASAKCLPRKAPTHLSWVTLAFATDASSLDVASAVLSGLFECVHSGRAAMFDTKLWLFVQTHSPGPASVLVRDAGTPSPRPPVSRPKLVAHWVCVLAGVGYLVATLTGNASYLGVLRSSLANDFGWAGFNTSGMQRYLVNRFNFELLLALNGAVTLDSPARGDVGRWYNVSVTTALWYPSLARRQLFAPETPLTAVVSGLRSMDPCQLPWMFTQYCYLDLDKMWEMATTEQRQERCARAYATNGAVYLELPLRNVADWEAWTTCWGQSFDIAFARVLRSSKAGQGWLDTIISNTNTIDQEAAYWATRGIRSYALQWQNYKLTGMADSLAIQTALGSTYTLPLATFPVQSRLAMQTSMHMYWAFASDLWAVATNATSIGGLALLRSSASFAFANTTPAALLVANSTLASPLPPGIAPVADALGPFGAVDMVYLPCPPALVRLFGAFASATAALVFTSARAADAFVALPLKSYLGPLPMSLSRNASVRIVGGDILCGGVTAGAAPSYGMYLAFGANNLCNWWYAEDMTPTAAHLLFALVAFNATRGLTGEDLDLFCDFDAFAEPTCASIYAAHAAFASAHEVAFAPLHEAALSAEASVRALGVGLVQFLQPVGSTAQNLYVVELLSTADRSWTFYSWALLYEWAAGRREVVAFEGDAGTLACLSSATHAVRLQLADVASEVGYLFQACATYVTYVLMALAGAVGVYSVVCSGRIEGWNLFDFNRIVGHVWVGRPLLAVRSLTAVWLLNTTPLQLVAAPAGTRLVSPRLPWFTTLLAASELTWLVYIANDLLSCVTQQYTRHYVTKSSLATYLIAVAYTFASPQAYAARLDRTCAFVNMDCGLRCTSGVIEIGRVSRLLTDGAIVVCSVMVTARWERWARPRLCDRALPAGLLSSAAFYNLQLDGWRFADQVYLDQASAVMAGLLTLYWNEWLYVFDVKLWRLHVKPSYRGELDLLSSRRLHHAIPLSDFS
ncbi:hypothetical protein ACHHYP_02659 [Achlya hypogyna]|uniref:Transmembrane protein n=1 Tax=Achlya hypogyna TaxID=1202772 RepID=A0A1V9Z5Y2_ACHHY|nr:hypothetical protein ACHHYP_02659 [Achlya hypogyna]